jgi:ATP-dependent Clp protease adaptor protein ClpS
MSITYARPFQNEIASTSAASYPLREFIRRHPLPKSIQSRDCNALEKPCDADYTWSGSPKAAGGASTVTKTLVKPRTKVRNKTERPPLYKVILLNDDYTPREFVVQVLKAVFRMNEDQAYQVMMTAHQKGACVIAVYVRDVAETKAKEATDLGKQNGFPLFFTTEPEQ